jgi:hypothetical protein
MTISATSALEAAGVLPAPKKKNSSAPRRERPKASPDEYAERGQHMSKIAFPKKRSSSASDYQQ